MLEAHFRLAYESLEAFRAQPESQCAPTTMSAENPWEAYQALWKTEHTAFDLKAKARLRLEVPELKSWGRGRKDFIRKRQAQQLARAMDLPTEANLIHVDMVEDAMAMLALQDIASCGQSTAESQCLEEWIKEHWGSLPQDGVRRKAEDTSRQRRAWFQQQRKFLMEDLDPFGIQRL